MSKELIESVITKNMLEANDILEARLNEIRAKKLYEMKRMFAAQMDEGVGGLTNAEIQARKKAGYKKASDVLGDPRDKQKKSDRLNPDAKIIKKKIAEDWGRAIRMGIKRTGTRLNVMRYVPGAIKDIAVQGVKNVVADPLDAAGKVTSKVVGGTANVAKNTGKGIIKSLASQSDL